MSTKVGDIFVRANLDRSQYNKGLGLMQREAQKVGASIGKKLGLGLGIAGFGAFIKKATDAGASLNAMGTIIDASLPNMTKQVDDFAKSAGQAFGLSETQAKGFVGKFASMASAMGYTEKQAFNMSTALTGLAGDVASYYHISQDDAYAKLGAVFTGETEALKQLGVVMTQNALDQFALQQGFGATTAQMTEMEKTTLRYMFVMDRLKLTVGDFSKYAYTWSGSIATIKLNWANFMATVGQGIINILLPLLQVIAKVSSALTALASRFLGWTKAIRGIKTPLSNAFGKKTQTDLKNVGGGVGNVGSGLGGVGKNAKGAKKQVQALKKELLGFDKITKLTGEQGVSTGGGGTGGAGGIGGGGIDFGDAEEDIKSFSEFAKNYLEKIQLPPALSLALQDLKDAFSNLFSVLSNAGKWAWDNILVPLGKWTLNELAPVAVETLANFVNLLANALKFVGTILEPLWEPIVKPFFQFLGDVAVSSVKALGDIFGFLAQVLGTASEGFKTIKEWVVTAIDTIKAKWEELKQNLTTILPKIELPTWDSIKSTWENLKKNFKLPNVSIKLKLPKWKNLKTAWQNLMAKFKDKKVTVTITTKIASGAKTTKQIGDEAVNKLTGNAGGGIFRNGRWSPIQRYASGGMPRGSQLFWARENGAELVGTLGGHTAVMNNDQIVASVSAGVAKAIAGIHFKMVTPRVANANPIPTGTSQATQQTQTDQIERLLTLILTAINNKDNNVYLDGEQIKNNVVRRINNHTRATGQLELII